MSSVVVIGAGPAGVMAALRAAELGAETTLVTSGEFGGMAANDGPVPVRTLAHAARLLRAIRQSEHYGLTTGGVTLDYNRLLSRVRDVVREVGAHSTLRQEIDRLGVMVHEQSGLARFADSHTVETERGLRLQADRFIIATGGVSRRLSVPGFELTSTHSDAWALTSVPPSMLVIGAGATGAQLASIFNAFGTRVELFQAGSRIIPREDEDVSAAVAAAFRGAGISVHENFGVIESFERSAAGVRMNYSRDGVCMSSEAALAVVATGWGANTSGLDLSKPGVTVDERGFVRVDPYLQTTATHVYAAGDVVGHVMLVPQALQGGFVAATNAVQGPTLPLQDDVGPAGGFTDPDYAQVGVTEAKARESHDVVVSVVPFDSTTRTIIDGHTFGFCKLIVDRANGMILGCHVVGEGAVEIVQVAAIAMAAGMRVDGLARVPLSFPTYTGILALVAADASRQLNLTVNWQAPVVQ